MIPVLRPRLPGTEQLLPYLRIIDGQRWYTNDGPLVRRVEHVLRGVCVANATVGLELAAREVFTRPSVRIPAFTFVATATALRRAGYTPVLCDVDPDTWLLRDIDEHSLPVAAFGAHVEGVLVDAAAAYGHTFTGSAVLSLHATKPLPAGEGGLVRGWVAERVRELRNFGLRDGLAENTGGTNAKMSEYHAAVLLASLEDYTLHRAARMGLRAQYQANLEGVVEFQAGAFKDAMTMPVRVPDARELARALAADGIETRQWYLPPLHEHPAFRDLPREALPNCDRLAREVLCLPLYVDLKPADVDFICERVWEHVQRARGHLRQRRAG